jgi:hypothetical protein
LFLNRNTATKQPNTDGRLELFNFINICAVNPTQMSVMLQDFPTRKGYLSQQDNTKWPEESNEEQESDDPTK